MRADRLVATLLFLQSKGRVTAAEVADELEISERTARRDLEALSMAGIPVYSQQGRGGGWELVGGARTDLTGLSGPEARALFLVAGPTSVATPALKTALRKLVQALPEPLRRSAEAASTAVVVDPAAWGQRAAPTPALLADVQQTVVDGVQVVLHYRNPRGQTSERTLHPYGLVAKGGLWYLIAGTDKGRRTFRVDRIQSIEPTTRPAERPADFDLVEAWREIETEVTEQRAPYRARAVMRREMVWYLMGNMGSRLDIVGDVDDERVELELRSVDARVLAIEVAGFASAIEVDDPDVRAALAEIGRELVATNR
jgi:predicted DNA-binding transcriptional regulator YafY